MHRFIQLEGNKSFEIRLFLLFLAFAAGALIFDLYTPIGYGVWIIYLLLIVIYRRFSDCRYIYYLSSIFIVFIVLGYIYSPPGLPLIYPLINRSAGITTILIFSYMTVREKEVKKINAEILERISDSFIAIDSAGIITYANNFSVAATGKQNIIGRDFWQEFPLLQNTEYFEKINEAIKTQRPVEFKMKSLISSNFFHVSAYPSSRGVSIFSKNVTQIEKAEQDLRNALKEKELLLKEIHHRVKNNFQLVSSLLGLSTAGIHDPLVMETISVVQQRIRTLAMVHEKLYQTDNLTSIDVEEYVQELLASFRGINNNVNGNIKIDIAVEDISLNLETAIPIGMILTELYTNSLKHAFNGRDNCKISVQMNYLNQDKSKLQMVYRDNGKGLPEKLDIYNTESLGFTIITSFVGQLNGQMTMGNNEGAEFKFFFIMKASA